ncbi:hypothetical protein N9782_04640 [Emcibacteraceae bacterium]|nr:hypothetical protein [Emcibacteraceae bacterium]
MKKPFISPPELFISTHDLDHSALHAPDDTEAVLDWFRVEPILSYTLSMPLKRAVPVIRF